MERKDKFIFWGVSGTDRAIRFNLFCGGRQKRISASIPHAIPSQIKTEQPINKKYGCINHHNKL